MKFHESILCFIKCPRNYISLNTQKENFYSVSLPEDVLKLRYKLPLKFCSKDLE